MNIKKITAFAAAVIMAAGICTGVPTGTGTGSPLAVTVSANTVSQNPGASAAQYNTPASYSATGGNGTIDVKWEAVSGATSYYVSADKKQANGSYMSAAYKNVTGTSCKFENLPADTYCIFIKSDNAEYGVSLDGVVVTGNESKKDSTKTTNEKADSFNLTPTLYDDGTVDITWNEIEGAYIYSIYAYYGISSELSSAVVSTAAKEDFDSNGRGRVKAISSPKYTVDISKLPKGETAKIQIVAFDKNVKNMGIYKTIEIKDLKVNKRSGTSSSSSSKSTKTASGKPYIPTVKLYDDNTADVTWKEVKGAYFYAIYVYIYDDWDESVSQEMIFVSPTAKKDFKSGDLSVKAISEAKYTVDLSAMPKGGYAFIYVAPADKNNKSLADTEGVSTTDLKVNKRSAASSSSKTAAPSNFKASKTKNSVTLKWDAADGADMYRVYKYNDKTGKYEKYKDVTSAKCTVSGLSANTKYKFKVVSYSKNKDGKYVKGESSKAVSVTTKK